MGVHGASPQLRVHHQELWNSNWAFQVTPANRGPFSMNLWSFFKNRLNHLPEFLLSRHLIEVLQFVRPPRHAAVHCQLQSFLVLFELAFSFGQQTFEPAARVLKFVHNILVLCLHILHGRYGIPPLFGDFLNASLLLDHLVHFLSDLLQLQFLALPFFIQFAFLYLELVLDVLVEFLCLLQVIEKRVDVVNFVGNFG